MRLLFVSTIALMLSLSAPPASAGSLCLPSPVKFNAPIFGVTASPPYDAPLWQSIGELRVPWLRAEIRWDSIEKKKGVYNFAAFDDFLLDAARHHVRILADFDHPPAWAARDKKGFIDRLEKVAAALALRSGGRISAWEVFNEPNRPGHGWPFRGLSVKDNAQLYAAAVEAMSTGLRSRGFNGPIVAGAVAMEGPSTDAFMKAFIMAAPCACYDYISVHPTGDIGRLAATQKTLEKQLTDMAAGLPVRLWFTAVGYGDLGQQNSKLAQALKESPDVRALFWSSLREPPGGKDSDKTGSHGLTNADNLRLPAFDTLKAWLKKRIHPAL